MFDACVQRFDGMDKNFLDGELNRPLPNSFNKIRFWMVSDKYILAYM